MIVLTAVFKALPGKEMELEQMLKEIVPKVQNEEGTVMYILNRSAEDKGQFLFYEMYKDQLALNFHMSTPYLRGLLKSINGFVAEEPQVNFYEDIASIGR